MSNQWNTGAPGTAPSRGADTYRPAGPPPSYTGSNRRSSSPRRNHDRREPHRNDVFQFGGGSTRESYRGSDNYRNDSKNDYRGDSYQDNYRSSHGDEYRSDYNRVPPPPRSPPRYRDTYRRSERSPPRSYDAYRPTTHHDDRSAHYERHVSEGRASDTRGAFDFRVDAPASIAQNLRGDNFANGPSARRNGNPPTGPRVTGGTRGRGQGGFARGGRGGRGGRRDWVPPKASERAFLRGSRQPTPELYHAMDEDGHTGSKFRALRDISDSEEEDMVISDDENDAGQPRKKVARVTTKAADGDSVPKWSNPDPYTILPPVDENHGTKKDMIKLIRKARVVENTAPKPAAVTDDFISFNFDDGDKEDQDEGERDDSASEEVHEEGLRTNAKVPRDGAMNGHTSTTPPPLPPPTLTHQPYSHRDALYESLPASNTLPALSVKPFAIAKQVEVVEHYPDKENVLSIRGISDKLTDQNNADLGSRKRTFDDKIKEPPPKPRFIKKFIGGKVSGRIISEWRPSQPGKGTTPWIQDHSYTENMGVWLHKEIMDFFNHVKPRDFEAEVRSNLVADLDTRIKTIFPDADVKAFGSTVCGIYLPTADLDLVVVSRAYMSRGEGFKQYDDRRALRKFGRFLENNRLCEPGSIDLILHAKVPLVKYVDRVTGLKVDVSFENNTGLIAIDTFLDWKIRYPAMPILVTLIKQFLTMRGLNEPVSGGIGGFSVTCLVVSFLALCPQIQSGAMIPEQHLGECLMEFLDLYGNEFDTQLTALRMKPISYISKKAVASMGVVYKANKLGKKFTILDPNRQGNDISGGAHNTETIVDAFAWAYDELQARMSELSKLPIAERRNQSILDVIIGADYSSFDIQRNHLEYMYARK